MLKLNKVFHTSGSSSDVFEDRIAPGLDRRKYLVTCKNKIRDYLKPLIRQATKEKLGMEKPIEPRFRTQGSWSYNTCVMPENTPPQQMDWDYGIYLPVTVWEENGPPHRMAKAYFDLVEALLLDLCKKEGWTLVAGKGTCIRIEVTSWAHIDIPLYAAPEAEFERIQERAALEARVLKTFDSADNFAESLEEQQQWDDLDHVAMATRSGEWKASDPEVVANWFRDRVAEHGEQLRRVCRYLKAWRDFHWETGGPTSISIMIAITQTFIEKPGRDDLAIENAAKHLAGAFLRNIYERGIDQGAEDFNRLNADERALAANRFQKLGKLLEQARFLGIHQKQQAIDFLSNQFGSRIPNDTNLIDLDNGANAIRSTTPAYVVAPVVPSTKAG